jgi:hypothetical protein
MKEKVESKERGEEREGKKRGDGRGRNGAGEGESALPACVPACLPARACHFLLSYCNLSFFSQRIPSTTRDGRETECVCV